MAKKKAVSKSGRARAKNRVQSRIPAAASTLSAHSPDQLGFPVVVVGASAGGLEAFTALLKALPVKTGMGFVLIQHLEPKHESALTPILARATRMPVIEVSDGMAVEPDHIYIIPPNKSLTIRKGVLRLGARSVVSGRHLPIDDFAATLAEEQMDLAIGVVLSGTGSDGTQGLKAIKAAGGVTFAQEPKTAQWPDMPVSAITAGAVDFVLSPKRIAAELARIGRHPYLAETTVLPEGSELDKICVLVRSATGVDFRLYKHATVRRRIARRMAVHKIESLHQYFQFLTRNRGEAEALTEDIFVHVTGFFRDPECFQALRKQVLSKLRSRKSDDDPIRIWVPGCSSGEEVYSIAMLLTGELGDDSMRTKIQIFGTDVRESAVEHARAGVYSRSAVAGVPAALLKRFFVATDHGYQVNKFLRDLCVFARHDLAKDPPFSRLNLISCRNVLIYLGPPLQKRVFSIFQYALKPGGFLFLGGSESIGEHSDAFIAQDRKHRIFLRTAGAAQPHFEPSLGHHAETVEAPRMPLASAAADYRVPDYRKEAEQLLLERYAPAALIVDADLHIVHFQGDTSPYVAPSPGQASFHLLKMVRAELMVDLRTAVLKARKSGAVVHRDNIRFSHHGRAATARVEVTPLKKRRGQKYDFLVVFQNTATGGAEGGEPTGAAKPKARTTSEAAAIERELASTREHLRALIAEHETAQQEMKAAHEEMQSGNEELQSTNEELETAQEELQSSNEELVTLNEELQNRNVELSALTSDLGNLLTGVNLPVLVLDGDLRIRRFTPVAQALFNLIPGDVGRPFSNIVSNLKVADWPELLAEVTVQGRPVEREIKDQKGRWYTLRMRSYQSSGPRIEGVLVVLLDTDLLHRALDEARHSGDYARAIVETVHEALVVLNGALEVVTVNRAFCEMFQVSPESAERQPFLDLGSGQWNISGLKKHLLEVIPKQTRVENLEVDVDVKGAGRRHLVLNARRVESGDKLILIAIRDVTDRRRAQEALEKIESDKRVQDALREREREVNAILDNTPDVILRLDREFRYTYVNARLASAAGVSQEAFIGRKPAELGFPQGLVDLWMSEARGTFETGRPCGLEFSYPSPGGSTEWEERIIPEFAPDGSVRSVLCIGREITEQKRMEKTEETNREVVRALAARLMTAHEEERQRLSRELHDQLCQQLASLALDLGALASAPLPSEAQRRLKDLRDRVVKATEEARHIAYQLHPAVLDKLGLVASLEALCHEYSQQQETDMKFTSRDLPDPIPLEVGSCLYRVAQEALQNVVKHSGARHALVSLAPGKDGVTLSIEDDGAGFKPEEVKGRGGLGLVSMAERARLVDGRLKIEGRPGRGTRITLTVPLSSGSE